MIRLRSNILLFTLFASIISCKKKDELAINTADTYSKEHPFAIKTKPLTNKYKTEKKRQVQAFYEKIWVKPNVNGSFLVAKNGEIIFEGYQGYSNIEKKQEITATTPLHLASVSKVLTAAVVLRLIDQGKLNLSDNINTILSPFPYPNVTIESLLSHRSGLPNYAYFTDPREIWDHSKTLTNQDVLDLMNLHHFPLQFPSQKQFAYCNTNYVILALVIEKLTGMKYPEAMQKLLFEPLKMSNTFVFDMKDKNNVSQTYKANKMRLAFDHLDGTYGDKNIYSTPRDLLKFDMATYSPKFLSKKLVEAVYKGYSYESKGQKNYGLGIRMYEWETGQKMFYHNGWWHGNTSAYVKLKNDTVAIFAISNKKTTLTYKSSQLAPLFGDYPVKVDKADKEE